MRKINDFHVFISFLHILSGKVSLRLPQFFHGLQRETHLPASTRAEHNHHRPGRKTESFWLGKENLCDQLPFLCRGYNSLSHIIHRKCLMSCGTNRQFYCCLGVRFEHSEDLMSFFEALWQDFSKICPILRKVLSSGFPDAWQSE